MRRLAAYQHSITLHANRYTSIFARMKRPSLLSLLAATALLASSLTACNTGTATGDTNVESGANKTKDPDPGQTTMSDSATAGLQRDTAAGPTGRQVYENAAEAVDRDKDGIAD
jgi:predicted small secreted protein